MTEAHLRSRTNTYYTTWCAMMDRCYNSAAINYPNYGGRSIIVCAAWHDFDRFVDALESSIGPKPPGMSLDRDNHNGHYAPGKVKWSTPVEQASDRRPQQKRKGSKSSYKGVYAYNSLSNPWEARGHRNYKSVHLGVHATEVAAAQAFDTWAFKTFGPDYEGFNFPEEIRR